VLSVIVKRKHVRPRHRLLQLVDAGDQRGLCLTAEFSDMFEANGLSIDVLVFAHSWKAARLFGLEHAQGASRCRAVGIDNESDQVP